MTSTPPWPPWRRISFRIAFVYFAVYVTPELLEATGAVARVGALVAPDHDFENPAPTGSGDSLFSWVRALTALLLAAVIGAVWSALGRSTDHARLARWLVWGVRWFLGVTMIVYGAAKVLPIQFGTLGLHRLVQPYGDSSPMGLLWTFMAASRGYTFAAGLAEVAAGVLLLFLRTTSLGALLAMAVMSQVLLLNLCYDVPVKLFSFHLLVLATALAAGDLRRLADLLLRRRDVRAVAREPLFASPVANRAFVWLKGAALAVGIVAALRFGPRLTDAPRPGLFGIHDVATFTRDGVVHPPRLDDEVRWRRLIIDRRGARVQRMDGSFEPCRFEVDSATGEAAVALPPSGERSSWTIEEVDPGEVVVRGSFDGHALEMTLVERDLGSFLLVGRGFHWVSERPFNR